MRVSIELPDPPRLEPLLQELSTQYGEVMRQLLHLQEEAQRDDRYAPILQAMQAQQDGLVQAFQAMMGMMQQGRSDDHQQMQRVLHEQVAAPQQEASDALLSTLRGIKRTMAGMPDDLGSVMKKSFQSTQRKLMKEPEPKPVPDSSRAVVKAISSLEDTIATRMKGSRNRTFGSNY